MDLYRRLHQILIKVRNKLTIFDAVVLVVVIILLATFTLFFRRTTPTTTIRVRVTDPEVMYAYSQPQSWYANAFQVGDMEVDSLNKPLAKIINVEKFNTDSSHKAVYLDMEVRALYDTRSKQFSFKGKPLIFGTSLRFNLKHVYFDSVVVRTPDDTTNNSRSKITAKAEVTNIPLYYADAIKKYEGKSIVDNTGESYLTLDKITKSPSKNLFKITDLNSITLKKEDQFYDVALDMTIYTKNAQGEYFAYEDIPLKIGEVVPVGFPEFTFYPLITDLNSQQ